MLAGLLLACVPAFASADLLPDAPLPADGIALAASHFADARGLAEMNDAALRDETGQAGSLLIADTIGPNALTNAPADGSANFTFYRVGLDGVLDFNANISKLQLGCGGVNDLLTQTPACDIDIDYLSFMGINAAGDAPGAAGSNFSMKRPFVTFAIKNATNPATREIVGFQLGGQSINGALSIGRVYGNGQVNQEHGGTCNTSTTTGAGVSNCNSGINSISGNLSLELSAAIQAHATVAIYNTTLNTCFGRITSPAGGMYGCTSNPAANATDGTAPFFVDAGGTRINQLWIAAAKLHIQSISLGCFFLDVVCLGVQAGLNAIVDDGYGQLKIDTRQVHYLLTPNTSNFFLSFQRQPVSWPNYSKTVPANNIAFDACNSVYSSRPARCGSAYAPEANTGWWLNAPGAKILNIEPPQALELGSVSIGTLLTVFSPEGTLLIDNPKIAMARPGNCYGSSTFC